MKNQYFGDINDYRKYVLLHSILSASDLKLLVTWMLTPDDGSTGGKFTSYLDSENKCSMYDTELFIQLKQLLTGDQNREVSLMEKSDLLPGAEYFSVEVPDFASGRKDWFGSEVEALWTKELIEISVLARS